MEGDGIVIFAVLGKVYRALELLASLREGRGSIIARAHEATWNCSFFIRVSLFGDRCVRTNYDAVVPGHPALVALDPVLAEISSDGTDELSDRRTDTS